MWIMWSNSVDSKDKNKNKTLSTNILSIKHHFSNKVFPLMSFQLSSFALPWLATIWFTYKQGLSEAGEFSFALAIISPLTMLLASPSRNFILTEYTSLPFALRSRLLLMIFGIVIVLSFSSYFGAVLLFSSLFLFKITELLFDIPISIAVHKNQLKNLWLLSFSKWLIIAFLIVLAVFIADIALLFVICALCFVILVWLKTPENNRRGSFTQLFGVIKTSMPLGITALIFSLQFNIPRYVIGSAAEKELLAIYSISSFLIMGAVVLINVFIQAKLPIIKKIIQQQREKFKGEIFKLVAIAVIIYLSIQVAHFPVIAEIFWAAHNNVQQADLAYSELYQQILWLAWGPIAFSLVNYFLMLSGQHKILLLLTSANLIFTYIACTLALQYAGVSLLLWAYNLGCALQCVGTLVLFKYSDNS